MIQNRKTCSICLSTINKIDFRNGKKKKLLCGHVFHDKCISRIYKMQCPLCEHPILNSDEEKLLKCKDEQTLLMLLKNNNVDVKKVFKMMNDNVNDDLMRMIYKNCDFTDVLAENMHDIDLVNKLIENDCKINWFKTFNGGSTFVDIAYASGNEKIVDAILRKLPIPDDKRQRKSERVSLYPDIYRYFPPSAPLLRDIE